jgi:hypothetical protein
LNGQLSNLEESRMTKKTEPAAVSHRLVNLRARSAGCSCGITYEGEGSAELRAQHKAHKANVQPAKKATARKAASTPGRRRPTCTRRSSVSPLTA